MSISHGHASRKGTSAEYWTWKNMKARCLSPTNPQYSNYGGRGIRICERWLANFENFLADMGSRPSSKHSLDRYPDNNGNYEPGNVRWATQQQQTRNRRGNHLVTINEDTRCLTEWAEISGVNAMTIEYRLKTGIDPCRAVFLPPHSLPKKRAQK